MKKRDRDLIDEIHERRTDLMNQCGNDLDQLGKYLKSKEAEHTDRLVKQIKDITKK